MAMDWAALAQAVQEFHDTKGWWPSQEEIDALVANQSSPAAQPPAGTAAAANSVTVGSGSGTLELKLSQDAWEGDAQYTVKVDGTQIGGTFTAGAIRGSGQVDTLTLKGEWSTGDHSVEVNFLNDAWAGTAATDRNLYLEGASINGQEASGATLALMSAGPQSVTVTDRSAPVTSGAWTSWSEFAGQPSFADEFDGGSVDAGKWPITYGGGGTSSNGAFRWDGSEVSVWDGALHIGMEKQWDGAWDVGGVASMPNQWHPGFGFTYGKVEIMAKVSQEVWGTGPVFLLWPAGNDRWPPEVDILETPQGNGMFTNHWRGPGGSDEYTSSLFEVDLSQWHVYGLEWTPDRLTMTVDGQVMVSTTENVPHEPMSIALQGHVGAAHEEWYGGSPNGSGVDRVDIAVDYVRVYDYLG